MPHQTPNDDQQADDRRFKFEPTINLGHIITAASLIVAVMVSWSLMDKRVVVLEEARAAQRERDTVQDASNREKFQEVRETMIDLRRAVEKVADKVGAR